VTEAPDTIVSDRLELRPLVPGDAAEMVSVLADERLYAFTGGGPPAPIVEGGREASIAWVIGVAWQGQGYATEAAGLAPTNEVTDGERVWRGPQPNRNPETPATTDESR
jgi:RimJ/RimL family protein N-acetyltransferase